MTNDRSTIKVRQIGSSIRRDKRQLKYLRSLGLRRIGAEQELVANDCVLKLIDKVRHLVKVISK